VIKALATFFGIGRIPYAPGTVASFAALLIARYTADFVFVNTGPIGMWFTAVAIGLVAVWVCDAYARQVGRDDPPECVIDEVAGQWLACAFAIPRWKCYLVAFALFRLLDIFKPWPISRMERLKGGWGIVADDMAAGAIAGIVIVLMNDFGVW